MAGGKVRYIEKSSREINAVQDVLLTEVKGHDLAQASGSYGIYCEGCQVNLDELGSLRTSDNAVHCFFS